MSDCVIICWLLWLIISCYKPKVYFHSDKTQREGDKTPRMRFKGLICVDEIRESESFIVSNTVN